MEYSADRWVQRLRDGQVPRIRSVVAGVLVLAVLGVGGLVLEVTYPAVVARALDGPRGGVVLVAPAVAVVAAVVLGVSARLRTRQDRIVVAAARGTSDPRFFLPAVASALAPDPLPGPRPTVWTVDATGLHGWTPVHDRPVLDLPWHRVRGIGLHTVTELGQRIDTGIEIEIDDGTVVVIAPRSTLGRPFSASQTRIDVFVRVLRSLRRELDPQHGAVAR